MSRPRDPTNAAALRRLPLSSFHLNFPFVSCLSGEMGGGGGRAIRFRIVVAAGYAVKRPRLRFDPARYLMGC